MDSITYCQYCEDENLYVQLGNVDYINYKNQLYRVLAIKDTCHNNKCIYDNGKRNHEPHCTNPVVRELDVACSLSHSFFVRKEDE